MPHLYVNTKGEAWKKHSFSAGQDYDQSPLKYYLRRVVGWREKDTMARLMFGRAIEQAVEFYHDNNGKGLLEKFNELWAPVKEMEGVIYTRLEKDWGTLRKMGIDMLKLYQIRQPNLPIPLGGSSVFQREYAKLVYPDDPNYGEIVDAGKLDIVAYVQPDHPALPKIEWKPEMGLLRSIIIDMKTSGKDYPEEPGMPAFDKQLRRYSWQSGIRDVAFVVFVKKSLGYKKNSRVTILEDVGVFKAGTEMLVAHVTDSGAYLVGSILAMEDMNDAQGKKADGKLDTTKAATLRKEAWLDANAHHVPEEKFTRQRLQFNAGRVTDESAWGAGQIAGRQIVAIVNSFKNNAWPDTFGIRHPQDDRNDPYFRAFVLKDEMFKEQNFKLASEEELSNIFDEENDPEESDD